MKDAYVFNYFSAQAGTYMHLLGQALRLKDSFI